MCRVLSAGCELVYLLSVGCELIYLKILEAAPPLIIFLKYKEICKYQQKSYHNFYGVGNQINICSLLVELKCYIKCEINIDPDLFRTKDIMGSDSEDFKRMDKIFQVCLNACIPILNI